MRMRQNDGGVDEQLRNDEQLLKAVKENLIRMEENHYEQLDFFKELRETTSKKEDFLRKVRSRSFKNAVLLTGAAGVLAAAVLVTAKKAALAFSCAAAIGKRL